MKRKTTLLIAAFLLIINLVACSKPLAKLSITELLDLGEKYLFEMDYEKALVQFLKVIEIEPMNPRGYIGAAKVYIGMNQVDKAVEVLKLGYEQTGDNEIRGMLLDLGVDEDEILTKGNFESLEIDSWGEFSEGLWRVEKSNKWGYIDKSGNTVIPFVYEDARNFFNGLAVVKKDGKYGLIDKKGDVVLAIEYDWELNFINGYSTIEKDGKMGIVDEVGSIIVPIEYDIIEFKGQWPALIGNGQKFGYVDNNGKIIVPVIYDITRGFSEGYAMVSLDNEVGIINSSGEFILPLGDYNYTIGSGEEGLFHEGLAQVAIRDGYNYSITGFIDTSGKVVLKFPNTYNLSCGNFSNGRCSTWELVGDKLKYGYLDKSGNLVIPYIYDFVTDFQNGAALVVKANGDIWKWGLINTAGDVLVPIEYDNLKLINGSDTVYYAEKEGKYGLFANGGEALLPVEYEDFNFYYTGSYNKYEKTSIVNKEGKYGAINNHGEFIIPLNYDYIGSLKYGLASVRQDGQYVLINISGDILIPFGKYDSIFIIGDGLVWARQGDDWQIIEVN